MAQKKNFKNPAMQFISAAEEEREAATDTATEEAGKIAPAQSEKGPAEDPTESFRRAAQAAGVTIPKGYRLAPEFKSARIQLLVKPTTKKAIQKAAAERGLTMNALINTILDEFAERQEQE